MKKLPHGLAALGLSVLALGCDGGRGLLGELFPGRGPPPPPAAPPTPPRLDAGSADASPPPPPCASTEDVMAAILRPKCSVCHDAGPVTDPPDLLSPGVRQRLLDGKARLCHERPYVTIGSDGEVGGHLFAKLAGPVAGCGQQMPFGAFPPLTDDEVACLRRWLGPSWQEPALAP